MKKGRAVVLLLLWELFLLASCTTPMTQKVMVNGKWYYFLPSDNKQVHTPQQDHHGDGASGFFDVAPQHYPGTSDIVIMHALPVDDDVADKNVLSRGDAGIVSTDAAAPVPAPQPVVTVPSAVPTPEPVAAVPAAEPVAAVPAAEALSPWWVAAALREADYLQRQLDRLRQSSGTQGGPGGPAATGALPNPLPPHAVVPVHSTVPTSFPAPFSLASRSHAAASSTPSSHPPLSPALASSTPVARNPPSTRAMRDGLRSLFKAKSGFAPASGSRGRNSKSSSGGLVPLKTPASSECLSKCPAKLSAVGRAPLPPHAQSHAALVLAVCEEHAPWLLGFDCAFASVHVYTLCARRTPFEVPPHLVGCAVVHDYVDPHAPPQPGGNGTGDGTGHRPGDKNRLGALALQHLQQEAERTGRLQRHYAAYFRHIATHYDDLSQLTLFAHGAVRPGFGQVLPSLLRVMLGAQVSFYAFGMALRVLNYDVVKADVTRLEALLGPAAFRTPLLKGFFCSKAPPRHWSFSSGGLFAVSRNRLHMWPKCKYEGLTTHLRAKGPGNAFTLPSSLAAPEGHAVGTFDILLPAIFGCNPDRSWTEAYGYVCMGVETTARMRTLSGVPEIAPFA